MKVENIEKVKKLAEEHSSLTKVLTELEDGVWIKSLKIQMKETDVFINIHNTNHDELLKFIRGLMLNEIQSMLKDIEQDMEKL